MKIKNLENVVVVRLTNVTMEECKKVQKFEPSALVLMEKDIKKYSVSFDEQGDTNFGNMSAKFALGKDGVTPYAQIELPHSETETKDVIVNSYALGLKYLPLIEAKIKEVAGDVTVSLNNMKDKIEVM